MPTPAEIRKRVEAIENYTCELVLLGDRAGCRAQGQSPCKPCVMHDLAADLGFLLAEHDRLRDALEQIVERRICDGGIARRALETPGAGTGE